MDITEEIELQQKREYLVVKGNDLIQQNRFKLSLSEQKAVAYICSMIKPQSTMESYKLEYVFDIREFCKVCGIDYDNGKNYNLVKQTLKKLHDRSMWLTMEDGSETLISWIDRVTTNKRSGKVTIRLDDRIAPYLFNLREKFTQYQLYNILAMKSAFSIRIYEIAKSYAFRNSIKFDLDKLKLLLMVDNVKSYDRFPDFRRYVLEPAKKEINDLTDINIEYESILKGRKVVQLILHISQKNVLQQTIISINLNNSLNKLIN